MPEQLLPVSCRLAQLSPFSESLCVPQTLPWTSSELVLWVRETLPSQLTVLPTSGSGTATLKFLKLSQSISMGEGSLEGQVHRGILILF